MHRFLYPQKQTVCLPSNGKGASVALSVADGEPWFEFLYLGAGRRLTHLWRLKIAKDLFKANMIFQCTNGKGKGKPMRKLKLWGLLAKWFKKRLFGA
ncbi:MAG: hypothetical protein J7L57_06150 [Deltaproteobacteria bacterium]|nr:hypothetical protein [Candidatus Tharpella sp.]